MAMILYPFSQLIREIFENIPGVRARVYKHTPSEQNTGDSKNFLTAGGAILANFFVAPPRGSSKYAFVVAPRNSIQNRSLQLRKKGI
jgi:hypothetical protein